MPRSTYFANGIKSEQDLMESLTIESIRIHGIDCVYIPRKIVQEDKLLNEDYLSKFAEAFTVEMYLESYDGFEGDGKFLSKFGLEIRDQVILVVARRRWRQLVSRYSLDDKLTQASRPREGDLIYFPLNKGLFEIKYTDGDKPFQQLKNVPTYRLTCELFEYRNEEFDTGVEAIDRMQLQSASTEKFRVSVSESADIEINTEVTLAYGDSQATAEFISIESDGDEFILELANIKYPEGMIFDFPASTTIIGGGLSAVVIEHLDLSEETLMSPDRAAQNSEFERLGEDFIDFSETNPFGEP